MKPILNHLFTLLISAFALMIPSQKVNAQPQTIKTSAKSVFTLTTFTKDGRLIDATRGVFIGNNGEAVSAWKPFVGADSAVVINTNGEPLQVETIIGANELYDVCKFRVAGKATPAKLSNTTSKAGGKVWLVGYALKSPEIIPMKLQNVETFMDKYAYYIVEETAPDNAAGCPFVNEKGEVIGLLQHANTSNNLHAVDINFINDMQITSGLAVADPVLRQTNIRIQLPAKENEALIALVMAGNNSIQNYPKYVNDFKKQFPQSIEGYTAQANLYINNHQLSSAKREMETALKMVTAKDVAHSEYAKLIYQQQVLQPDSTFTAWSLDKAMEQAIMAYQIKPNHAYQHQQAQIHYAKGDYQKAYNMFIDLTKTPMRSSEIFYQAAQSKQQLQANPKEILSLLDSAVMAAPQPLTAISAPYLLARGIAYDQAGDYRKALQDYNVYDTLMLGRATHQFYYTRYKCHVQLKRYQQALNDIAHAAILNRDEPAYLAEMASLQLRVNLFDDAIKTAELCNSVAPDYTDAYLVKGLALIQKKQKKEGIEALNKAKTMGDPRAQALIDKYK